MEPWRTVAGIAAPLMTPHISTDILVPSRVITTASRTGYGPKLLANWRYLADGRENPEFILNQAPWREACVLIVGENFGCGSSREMAVWALLQFGVRCVVAPSYASIFRENCVCNGLLPVVLPPEVVERLGALARVSPQGWTADLQHCHLIAPDGSVHAFDFDAGEREHLLLGLDPIGLTLRHADAIEAFAQADRLARPWIWA